MTASLERSLVSDEPAAAASWRRPWLHVASLCVLYLLLNITAGATGLWTADESVAHEQVESLVRGSWVEAVPSPTLDPEFRWHPLDSVTRLEGEYAAYGKHPLFPFLLAGGDLVFGRIGRFFVVALAAVGAAGVLGVTSERRRPGTGAAAFWLAGIGTPLVFHATTLWAHSIGLLSVALAMWASRRLLESERAAQPATKVTFIALFAAAVVLGVWTRSEAAIFFVSLGAAFAIVGLRQRNAGLTAFGAFSGVAAVAAFVAEGSLRAALFGAEKSGLIAAPAEAGSAWLERPTLVTLWLIGLDTDLLGLARVLGLAVLVLEALRARRGEPARRAVLALGVLCYAVALPASSTMAFTVCAPLLVVGLLYCGRLDALDRAWILGSAIFGFGVLVTTYTVAGGGDWGGRYLFLAVGPLVVVAAPPVAAAFADRRSLSGGEPRTAVIGAAGLAALLMVATIALDVVHIRRGSTDLAQSFETRIDALAPSQPVTVLATDARISRLIFEAEINREVVLGEENDFDDLVAALQEQRNGELVVLLDEMRPVTIPDSWVLLDENDGIELYRIG